MECLTNKIKNIFQNAFKKTIPHINEEICITHSNPKFGHYQCNNSLNIVKKYGNSINFENAYKLSEAVIENINEHFFEEIKATTQGFINIKISKEYISEKLSKLYKNNEVNFNLDINEIKEKNEIYNKVLIDFSSPNIAKEMHVGHLRSTILGDTISKIFEFLNIETFRINHIGDAGTQFGMIINYVLNSGEKIEFDDLTKLYQNAKKLYDNDNEFKMKSKKYAIELQKKDNECVNLWNKICECSKKEFEKIYKILNINFEYMGESFYIDYIPDVLNKLKEQNLLTYIDEALCYKSDKFTVPLFLQKSNGGFGYDSTDITALYYRLNIMKTDIIIYVTDNGQKSHFDILFELTYKTNWTNPNTKLIHVGFGLILGEDNKKFKTRCGTSVKLIDLINEGIKRTKNDLLERINLKTEEEKEYFKSIDLDELSKKLCISAIKYFDIKQNRNSDYKFSYDSMLNVKGNTGIYILYAYSRICSIFRKVNINLDDIPKEINLTNIYEINLGFHILKFPDVLYNILKNMFIHKLADYTYDLTTIFTSFYENCKVIGSENMNTRLLLCDITKSLLHLCLELMGITPVEKL